MRAGAPLIVVNETRNAQFGKHPLRLLGLHSQLERYRVDRRECAIVCRCKAPQINEGLEQRCVEALHFWIIDKIDVDAEPAGHGAAPSARSNRASASTSLQRFGQSKNTKTLRRPLER